MFMNMTDKFQVMIWPCARLNGDIVMKSVGGLNAPAVGHVIYLYPFLLGIYDQPGALKNTDGPNVIITLVAQRASRTMMAQMPSITTMMIKSS
jgi:hypothetical protein